MAAAVALICAGVVLATLATTGRTVGAERAVLARIDDAGTRTIQAIDDRAVPGLDVGLLEAITRLDAVDWAIGLGPIQDVRPAGLTGAPPVPARVVMGASPDLLLNPNTATRVAAAPTQVEALMAVGSQRSLGFEAAAGTVESGAGEQYPVTGVFRASGPLAGLSDSVLLVGADPAGPLRRISLQVHDPESVPQVADAIRGLLENADGTTVEVSEDLVLAQAIVRGELSGFGRAIVLQALAAGLILMAGAVLAGVNARRRDFGRRRALGATRGQLVGLVVAQASWSAIPGVTVGAVAGSALARTLSGSWPGWQFPLAISLLTTLSAALSALVPAVLAAIRDPVVALRVP